MSGVKLNVVHLFIANQVRDCISSACVWHDGELHRTRRSSVSNASLTQQPADRPSVYEDDEWAATYNRCTAPRLCSL